jgi:hypothetical protein
MTKNNEEFIYTAEAIEIITKRTKKLITRGQVARLCATGILDAIKEQRNWRIKKQSVLDFERSKPGIKKGFKYKKPRKK